MAFRALIIGIENYPNATAEIARRLEGTLQAALEFKDWLERKWRDEGAPDAARHLLFLSDPIQPGGRGATRVDIINALNELKTAGQNATEELFVFFSGHGFSYANEDDRPADFLISSEYQDATVSGPTCFSLGEIKRWLGSYMGPGRHYFFIDACRNKLTPAQIRVDGQLIFAGDIFREPSTYVLQSTVPGTTAAVGGSFPKELIAGLKGKGKAKAWRDGEDAAMFVRYDSLRNYLRDKMRAQPVYSTVGGEEGESDGVLATLRPVPSTTCTIEIRNATTPIHGEVEIRRVRGEARPPQALDGARTVLKAPPDFYDIAVWLTGAQLTPAGPVRRDLYDDETIVFDVVAYGPPEPPPPAVSLGVPPGGGASVAILAANGATIEVRDVNGGVPIDATNMSSVSLRAGRYLATARARDNYAFRRIEFEIEPGGAPTDIDFVDWRQSAPHRAIASRLPVRDGGVEFSESLGGVETDSDLSLWLALLGGSRILPPLQGEYSKLAPLPLHSFSTAIPGDSPIYILAGMPDPTMQLSIRRPGAPDWEATSAVPDMAGIREFVFAAARGSQLISLRWGDDAPCTIATTASPNRATLITFTLDPGNVMRVAQYMLPIGHLVEHLDSEVRSALGGRNHLEDLRRLARAHRSFRRRRPIEKVLDGHYFDELLFAKWMDPIGAAMAAYELVRRGDRTRLQTAVNNLITYFPDLPDSSALAHLIDVPRPPWRGAPLFLDGVRAFPDASKHLPLPAGLLDFSMAWTCWRGIEAP